MMRLLRRHILRQPHTRHFTARRNLRPGSAESEPRMYFANWEPRKTRSVHASTSSARTELVDLYNAVRTEPVEVLGFSRLPIRAYVIYFSANHIPVAYAGCCAKISISPIIFLFNELLLVTHNFCHNLFGGGFNVFGGGVFFHDKFCRCHIRV